MTEEVAPGSGGDAAQSVDPVDAIIDAAETESSEQTAEEAPEETPEETSEGEESQAEEKAKNDEPFPKKAQNAISRRDKRIGKLRAQKAELENRLKKYESVATQSQPEGGEPKEADFETYGEYLAALTKFHAKQEFEASRQSESKQRSEEAAKELEGVDAELNRARIETIDESAKLAMEAFADFDKVIDSVSVNVQGRPVLPLSDTAKEAFLEAGEDAAFALYSIAKEGTLEELNELSPYKAAMMIARHVDKGRALPKTKHISSAPEPIAAAKGNSRGKKLIDNMNADELREWMAS